MTFRTKLLLLSSITVAGAVALVTGAVSVEARRAFERADGQRRSDLLAQLLREMDARGAEVVRQVERAASSAGVERIAVGSAEFDQARQEAAADELEFLDVVQPDLTILSSAHWPARFGYPNDWGIAPEDWLSTGPEPDGAFLARIPLPDGASVMALVAVRRTADKKALVAGGRPVNPAFLKSLGDAPGMRALLWLPPGEVVDAQGGNSDIAKLASLVNQARATDAQATSTVQWTSTRSSAEAFLAFPLQHRGQIAGVLLAGTSLAAQLALENEILWIGVAVAASGILIGILLGWWTTERVTRPVTRLAIGARAVAGGDWSARVEVLSNDEIGELAKAFNRMTEQLAEQRDRALQAERVAAWRELARRLAHELKNPLFPLQITIENLRKARKLSETEFEEVFRESTGTLLAELGNLKTIIGRFSDFAKMPRPHFEAVDLNEIVQNVMKLYDAQLKAEGKSKIDPELQLAEGELRIQADGEQLRRAIGNLVLNAIDAMPRGGVLRVESSRQNGHVRLAVSDTGQGLTQEECDRLFTPYYTTKQHGTGLGLAIVQSVVSDHGGKISVVSAPGRGATFVIELPVVSEAVPGEPA
ncbi:MAG TPA: ATP-binding protein [Bryobacteraceae bacterium]|nr:ATP-binding protein [Bryobacteraceae bacterium]